MHEVRGLIAGYSKVISLSFIARFKEEVEWNLSEWDI